jgi:dUTPase
MSDIKFKLSKGAKLPTFGSVGLEVKANNILKIFKGDIEVSQEILDKVREGFHARGFIKLRVNERILFGTGLQVQLPEDMELQIRALNELAEGKGVVAVNQPGTVGPDFEDEIGVLLANYSSFLPRIDKGEGIANLVPATIIKTTLSEF